MKLLVFGQTGQVAQELARRAGDGLSVTCLSRQATDLTDAAALTSAIERADTDAVINAAAYTAVDKAEEEAALAHAINGTAPGAMAAACAARGLPFVHISTDYVFDGTGDRPWREDDPTGPQGVYGASKLAGEQAVTAAGGAWACLRTAWVFSAHGNNFVKTMLRVGATRDRLTVVEDQHGGPTWAGDIAGACIAVARGLANGKTPGIYHYAGAPPTTWAGFAREIFARADMATPPEVAGIPTSAWPTPAKRPANSVLDCTRVQGEFGVAQPDWRAALDTVLKELS